MFSKLEYVKEYLKENNDGSYEHDVCIQNILDVIDEMDKEMRKVAFKIQCSKYLAIVWLYPYHNNYEAELIIYKENGKVDLKINSSDYYERSLDLKAMKEILFKMIEDYVA